MSELLQAEVDTLHGLATTLTVATAATTSAHTYEQLDQALATQLHRYTTGQQP